MLLEVELSVAQDMPVLIEIDQLKNPWQSLRR
jgi:hypothetical protein